MERFKFQLEKYHGRESRYTCPNCHVPHSFVRYVDEHGNYIAENVGRCNRETKCGYHLTPAEYFSTRGVDYQPIVEVVPPKPVPPTDYIPEQMMVKSLKTNNFLIQFLSKYFQPLELAYTIDKYRIGDAKDGRTIYWQIDEDNRVRTGKIMLYDPHTGHRVKNQPNSFDWAHRYVKKPFQLEQCLYGLHLLNKETKPIAIVESEKSAIVASMVIPDYLWLATGGKGNFRLMEAVRGRDVTLFPDLGAYDQWSEHAARYGFKISRLLENMASDEERKNGLDIADYILKFKENERIDNKVA